MKNSFVVLSLLCLITVLGPSVWATTVVEFPLDNPVQYVRDIGPMIIQHNSPVDIYVANVLDEQRWKDWSIIIGILPGQTPLTSIQVDYDNTPNHSQPIALFDVPLASYGTIDFMGQTYNCYYANTWLAPWEQFGTNPVGSTGPYAIGNPAWVSFHFDVNVDLIRCLCGLTIEHKPSIYFCCCTDEKSTQFCSALLQKTRKSISSRIGSLFVERYDSIGSQISGRIAFLPKLPVFS